MIKPTHLDNGGDTNDQTAYINGLMFFSGCKRSHLY